ncbi:MAG: FAD-dependent oxidoreductase [Limnochordia bacterium]|jgi:hypothetical protein
MQIPVIYSADVIIFGARSGAVVAALAAKKDGCSVVVVSDRSYFGEETAGALQLWPEFRLNSLLTVSRGGTVTPQSIKHSLELALLHEHIPFLFECRPVSLLRNEDGALAGVVIAARTALYAVTGRVLMDVSRSGLLARLAELPLVPRMEPSDPSLVVIGSKPPATADFAWHELQRSVGAEVGRSGGPLNAYRLHSPVADRSNTLAERLAADYAGRARVHYPGIHTSADTWTDVPSEYLVVHDIGFVDRWSAVPDTAFIHCEGRLIVMNELLPLTAHGAATLATMEGQLGCGDRAGRLAATQVRGLPARPGRLACSPKPDGCALRYRFSQPFLRQRDPSLVEDVDLPEFPLLAECDVLVAGGGTAGAAAGIAAARSGADTIVVERLHGLGGLGTLGLVTGYYLGNRTGFTAEINTALAKSGREPTSGRSNRWDPSSKMGWYMQSLHQAGGAAWLNSFAFGAHMEGSRLTGVLVSTPLGVGLVRAENVIDATGNADLAAATGAPCCEIDATHVAVQGTGLSPHKLGTTYSNTDYTFVDDNDVVGVTHAFVTARAKFPEAFDVVPMVGSRERRRIVGEMELSPVDFLTGRTFPDTIVTAESNFDTHGFTVHPVFAVLPADKTVLRAHVPFRCMLPRGVDGLLVTGLGVSAHRDAMPVIRMQADVQNQGYAAGMSAAAAAQNRCRVRNINIRELQQRLVAAGVLEPAVLTYKDTFPSAEQLVREAVSRGPVDAYSTAVILSHPTISMGLLSERLRASKDPRQVVDAALILGLYGRPEAAHILAQRVSACDWDEGWDYTGMRQFGLSLSRMDALVIALGKTLSPVGTVPVLDKIRSLGETSAFSHCRAVSIAASALRQPELAEALYQLLRKPEMQGHAQLDTSQVIATVTNEPNQNGERNAALKELILARGLYLCGDWHGLGKRILATYSMDLRGHFARHAGAVLKYPDPASLGAQVW